MMAGAVFGRGQNRSFRRGRSASEISSFAVIRSRRVNVNLSLLTDGDQHKDAGSRTMPMNFFDDFLYNGGLDRSMSIHGT
jgi:hypothetical protein